MHPLKVIANVLDSTPSSIMSIITRRITSCGLLRRVCLLQSKVRQERKMSAMTKSTSTGRKVEGTKSNTFHDDDINPIALLRVNFRALIVIIPIQW